MSISKIIFIILLEYSETPPLKGAPGGGGARGAEPYTKISYDTSILGFSRVEVSKSPFFFKGTLRHLLSRY